MKHAMAGVILAVGALLVPAAVSANDRWETGTNANDDGALTHNELVHGTVQIGHDLEGAAPADQDWMRFRAKARHSYEARVGSGTTVWFTPGCGGCARFDRVDVNGAVLTPGLADGAGGGAEPTTMTVRWITVASGDELLRVVGESGFTAQDTYDVSLYDTTYFLPRFNNSATQVTVLLVQNVTDFTVAGNVDFYNTSGSLLASVPLNLPAQGLMTLNTSTVGGLTGQGGSAAITHLGGYGALTGKAVALEPATGFTFDTEVHPLPR